MKAIAVIDHSTNSLFIYDINEKFTTEQIEKFLDKKHHHLSNCSWGEFDGEIIDNRD